VHVHRGRNDSVPCDPCVSDRCHAGRIDKRVAPNSAGNARTRCSVRIRQSWGNAAPLEWRSGTTAMAPTSLPTVPSSVADSPRTHKRVVVELPLKRSYAGRGQPCCAGDTRAASVGRRSGTYDREGLHGAIWQCESPRSARSSSLVARPQPARRETRPASYPQLRAASLSESRAPPCRDFLKRLNCAPRP
jgi:hypothetical protein